MNSNATSDLKTHDTEMDIPLIEPKINRTVYLKGRHINIVTQLAPTKAKQLRNALTEICGEVHSITARNQSLKVVCRTLNQKTTFVQVDNVLDTEIITTLPVWSVVSVECSYWRKVFEFDRQTMQDITESNLLNDSTWSKQVNVSLHAFSVLYPRNGHPTRRVGKCNDVKYKHIAGKCVAGDQMDRYATTLNAKRVSGTENKWFSNKWRRDAGWQSNNLSKSSSNVAGRLLMLS